jgi:hypothetical protein
MSDIVRCALKKEARFLGIACVLGALFIIIAVIT